MAYNKKFWKSKQQAERMIFGMIWALLKDGYRSGEIKELCREEYSLGISEAEAIMFNSERSKAYTTGLSGTVKRGRKDRRLTRREELNP